MDDYKGSKRVFQGRGGPSAVAKKQKVCYHWRRGRCIRSSCPYIHGELIDPPLATSSRAASMRAHAFPTDDSRRNPNFSGGSIWGPGLGGGNRIVRKAEKLCDFWVQGTCSDGDKCGNLHSWSLGESFSLLTELDGHQKSMAIINLGGEVGSVNEEGPWVFVGVPNFVKAWNIQTSPDMSLSGPVGQVSSLVVGNGLLFAGIQDGSILAWKFDAATNGLEPVASLKGHTLPVVSLVVGASRLYSGSRDHSIKVWSLESLQCLQTLTDHTSVVTSLLCWEQFVLSCSLDQTIKVWAAKQSGNLEVTYTHKEDCGLLTLCGVHDSDEQPVLLCSCNDNSVRLYDFPSFSERGIIFSKQEIRSIQPGPGGIFFTGDGTGQVKVWKWLAGKHTSSTGM